MKINWNKHYTTLAIYACIVGAAIIFCIFLGVYSGSVVAFFGKCFDVLAPIFYGAAIAYIINPLLKLFEKRVFRKLKNKTMRRAFGMILSYSVFFALIVLLVYALVPQLARSFSDLQNNLILYANSLQEWVDSISSTSPWLGGILQKLLGYIDLSALSQPLSQLFESLSELLSAFSPYILSFVNSLIVQVRNILLGIVFSAYFLASKELVTAQLRKLLHALLPEKRYSAFAAFVHFTDRTFGRYLLGTLLDSILVGVEFFIILSIFNIPYAPLVSVVCGFTNMIPIFGPFIGAIPSFLIIFISSPIKAIWFVVIVLVVQQIDGNIIAPRIIGESTGLSAIAVICSVTIMGGLFGIIGMVIGVPLFAVFASLINAKTDAKIKSRQAARATPRPEGNGADGAETAESVSEEKCEGAGDAQ